MYREADGGFLQLGVKKTGPRTVGVEIENLVAGRVYQFDLAELESAGGNKIHNRRFCYTANVLR